MFGIAREFQAPMGVTHALRGRFGATPSSFATVFARKSSLDLYVIRANSEMARLELLQSTPLGANIMSIALLRRHSGADLLIVGFDRMRICILSWNHETRMWATDQLLDLGALLGTKLCSPPAIARIQDPEELGKPLLHGRKGSDGEPIIRADPSGRCFAVLAKDQGALYIIPVHAEDDSSSGGSRVVNRGDIFMIDLRTEYDVNNVKDFAFLHGSFEPNIIFLYEPKRTWSGRAAIQRNTCFLLNISIDVRSKRTSKTWTMDQLPYDCHKVEPIPESASGGALLISTNVIMQVRHGACVAGLSLNCFGDAYAKEIRSKYDSIEASDSLAECDATHCRFLDVEETASESSTGGTQSIALLSLKGGELYFLSVAVGSRSTLIMKRAGSTVIASEIVPINERFFVLASRLSDSLLVEYQRAIDDSQDDSGAIELANGSAENNPADGGSAKKKTRKRKRMRTAEEEAEYEMIYGVKPPDDSSDEESEDEGGKKAALELVEKDEGTRGVYDDEDELGWVFNSTDADSRPGKGSATGKWALKVKDTIPCFGPGADLAVGLSPDDITQTKCDMVVAGGYAKNGCLAVVHQTVRPTNRAEFEVQGCNGVWALADPTVAKREQIARGKRNEAAKRRNLAIQSRNATKLADRQRFVEDTVRQWRKEQAELLKAEKKAAEQSADNSKPRADNPNDEDNPSNEDKTNNKVNPSNEDTPNDSDNPNDKDNPFDDNANTQANGSAEQGGSVANGSSSAPEEGGNGARDPEKEVKTEDVGDEGKSSSAKRQKTEDGGANGKQSTEVDLESIAVPEEVTAELAEQAEATFPLEAEEELEEDITDEGSLHSYMLLSTATSTTALKTGVEIEEVIVDSIDFITTEPTITAGNVFGTYAMAQVVPSRVRLLRQGKTQCEFNATDGGGRIKRAQVADPLILLETEDSSIIVLCVQAEECEEKEIGLADGPSDVLEDEDVFDEYGMGLSNADLSGKIAGSDKTSGGEGGVQEPKSKGFKDFKLAIELSAESSPDHCTSVAAAALYRGGLSREIAEDGILTTSQDSADTVMEDDGAKGEAKDSEEENVEFGDEVPDEKEEDKLKPEDRIDDEDRMLYGEDNEDEEDMMLYGAGSADVNDVGLHAPSREEQGGRDALASGDGVIAGKGSKASEKDRKLREQLQVEKGVLPMPELFGSEGSKQHLVVVTKQDGSLIILSRSLQYEAVLECPLFFAAPPLIRDAGLQKEQEACPPASSIFQVNSLAMVELSGSALLPGLSTPILLAMSPLGIPIVYRAFMCSKSTAKGKSRSRLALERVIFRDRTAYLFARSMKNAGAVNPAATSKPEEKAHIPIVHFQNIASRGGMFVGGACPFFLFAERGYPRIHPVSHTNLTGNPMTRDDFEASQGWVGFTEFHNAKCPRGFVSVDSTGSVRIAELPPPSVMNYDAPTPMRKIALRCTPHKVAYHVRSATYGVLASMPTLTTREERLARILQSLEKHDKRHYQHTAAQAEAETGDAKANREPPLFEELHELRVYRPDTWDLIKSHKLDKGEVGLAIANMTVDVYRPRTAGPGADIPSSKKGDDGNESLFAASLKMRPKDMLVVGTGYLNGEDASSRGRLLLFEISRQEVYTDAGGVYTAFQLQLIAEKELFSPVTAVAAMEGYVIAGVGPQVSVYKLVGDEVVHLSFAFGQLYCTALASIKQYVVAADMWKSVSFMYFRDRNNSVNFLGKDYENMTSFATEFLIENENVSIIASDGKCNMQLLNYAHASVPESRGGKRLLVNGGIHFGSRINRFVRMRTPDLKAAMPHGGPNLLSGQHALLFATLDGSIGALVAVSEKEYRKLDQLRNSLVGYAGVRRVGGVNAEEQSAFRPENGSTFLLDQRLLDSRAVYELFGLSLVEMRMIAREAGLNLGEVVDCLMSVDSVLARF